MPNIKIECDEKNCEARVHVELSPETLEEHYRDALKELQKETPVKGFRPGNAPIAEVLKIHGEEAVMQKAAERAVRDELPKILAKENVLVVDMPKVTVEKLAHGNPLVFSATAPLAPKVKLPDYKNIAKNKAKIPEISITDEEHTKALTHLRRERARITKVELGVSPEEAAKEAQKMEEKDLPELDDAFVQTIGYEDVQKFSDSVRTHMKSEKERHEIEKRRAAILDELVEKSEIAYPAMFKEFELDDMEARIRADVERMGQTFDSYLAQAKKTRDELRKEWEDAADKRAKIRLILGTIARKENITADQSVVEKNFEQARKMYPNANADALRASITHALQNEAVLGFLEGQS